MFVDTLLGLRGSEQRVDGVVRVILKVRCALADAEAHLLQPDVRDDGDLPSPQHLSLIHIWAGLGLVDGVLRMVPAARVGHIGMYRDEETLEPHPYFCKMPKDVSERDVLIVDPMLATGGSAAEAIGEMKKRGCKHIKLMVLVAAPEGIKFLQEKHPDVDIYAAIHQYYFF